MEVDAMPVGATSGSPCSVMQSSPESLSVVLLMDGSSSVTEEDFNAMKAFCVQLVTSLRETHSDATVAVLQFNQYPKVHAPLTQVESGTLESCIMSIQQAMGSTDCCAPIRRARQMLAEGEAGHGEKAIVLLTDGQTHTDELREAEKEARQAALDSGARLFTLGVGRDVDESGLKRIAGGTSQILAACSAAQPMANGHYFPLRKMYR
jgi:uncharacterized protein YegL